MDYSPLIDGAVPGAVLGPLALGILVLIVIFILIVFVETITLQLLGWGDFRGSLRGAFWMNLASILFGFLALTLVARFAFFGLLTSWLLSTGIEAFVLTRLRHGLLGYAILVALTANLASYLLLILPAFLASR